MLIEHGLQKHEVVIKDDNGEQVIISVYRLPGLIRKLALFLETVFDTKEVASA